MSKDQALSNVPPSNVILKNLRQELRHAVQALWAQYSKLDLQIHTTLGEAEQDLLAAMPVIEGYENEIRQMVAELIEDVRREYEGTYGATNKPILLRFVNQDENDNLMQVIPNAE